MRRFTLWLVLTGAVSILGVLAIALLRSPAPRPEKGALEGRASGGPAARDSATEGSVAPGSAKSGTAAPEVPPLPPTAPGKIYETSYAGSLACKPCHALSFERWASSHHALAERTLLVGSQERAFQPARTLDHGTAHSILRLRDDAPELVTRDQRSEASSFRPVRWIGIDPLQQLVIPFGRGQLQVTDLAFDPARDEWFNVYGTEDRLPHEWGSWTGRGMTWNAMCAFCHTTHLEKRYDPDTDSYDTRWLELGVGCEACHGPSEAHVQWRREATPGQLEPEGLRPANGNVNAPGILDTCGACHARRAELTGAFQAPDRFLDHYRPTIPDITDTYYPDGQVRDENYEFVSFLSSRMYLEGVRCVNCHDPHTAKTRLGGNDLCLSCHRGKVEPGAHSGHDPTKTGGLCVNCHMPITVYMQRHPRRDHGFTIPDPLLTRELGIPNACNRCHSDQSVDWAVDAAARLFGDRLERPTRARARVVASGRRGDPEAIHGLLALLEDERSNLWRAVAVRLLAPAAALPQVQAALGSLLASSDPLLRSEALRALQELPLDPTAVRPLLDDPIRLVRVDAAWTLRRELRLETRAGRDLQRQLRINADQPTGALQQALFEHDRGDTAAGLRWLDKAISWDAASAVLYQARAVLEQSRGNRAETVRWLRKAAETEPGNAGYALSLGLGLAENDDLEGAVESLERAVEIDPRYARAWYNLGLARAQLGRVAAGLDALARAELEAPQDPEYPYARACVLRDAGRRGEAIEAARKAVEVAPWNRDAQALLRHLQENDANPEQP